MGIKAEISYQVLDPDGYGRIFADPTADGAYFEFTSSLQEALAMARTGDKVRRITAEVMDLSPSGDEPSFTPERVAELRGSNPWVIETDDGRDENGKGDGCP